MTQSDATEQPVSDEVFKWMLGLPTDKLVKVMLDSGRFEVKEAAYFERLIDALRAAPSETREPELLDNKAWSEMGPLERIAFNKGIEAAQAKAASVSATRTPAPEPEPHSFSLLRFEGVDGPTFFVMEERYGSPTEEDYQGHRQYFYEEHSCPTNWLRDCVAVIENGDADPHGFLSFVRSAPIPKDWDEEAEDWKAVFPEAFK